MVVERPELSSVNGLAFGVLSVLSEYVFWGLDVPAASNVNVPPASGLPLLSKYC